MANHLIATKRLSRVEVTPSESRQHEFHAGRLRHLLGFGTDRVTGMFFVTVHVGDGRDNYDDESRYTLYDAREGNPDRTEWHLYYYSDLIGAHAEAGDLLVLMRPYGDTDLYALIVRTGTALEKAVLGALEVNDTTSLRTFVGVPSPSGQTGTSQQIALSLLGDASEPVDVRTHPVYAGAVESGQMPSTREMAAAAMDIVASDGRSLDADTHLIRALDVESELFFAIERAIGERELSELTADGAGFDEVLAFAMRKHQSRRSRRGHSLQNHFEFLLGRFGIPFTAQCETENGERPDFVIPGYEAYHDPDFPESDLRMVGCKSRIRERWPQYLKEADRIGIKFHVTVDTDLSDDLIRKMDSHHLRLFMPRSLIEVHYADRDVRGVIRTIADLISELRSATVGRT